MEIKDSVALVTGANRGLGLAFVHALKAAGAKKIYAGVRTLPANPIEGVESVLLDVTNAEQVKAAAAHCSDVNLVVNNAGIARFASFISPDTLDDAQAEMDTNYFGPLRMARAFKPILAANGGGALVNVLSVLSWLNVPSVASYSASKAAAWSLTNGLRGELREQNTLVVGVHVGYMDTDMASAVDKPKSSPQDVVTKVLNAVIAGEEEVLADDLSGHVQRGLGAKPGIYLNPPLS